MATVRYADSISSEFSMTLARLAGANGIQEVSSFAMLELGAGNLVRGKRSQHVS